MPGSFVARAFQNGELVSNRQQVDNGNFTLISAAAASGGCQRGAGGAFPSQPWFKFEPFTPSRLTPTNTLDLGTVNLAAYLIPDPQSGGASIRAVGDEPGQPPVARADVRASALLETTTAARLDAIPARFGHGRSRQRDAALADRDPELRHPHLPRGGKSLREPLPDDAGGGPRHVGGIPLRLRPVRAGKLLSADNTPVANATVVATRSPPGPTECASPVQLTTTTTTKADGSFTLSLDPGTYQIDYIPQSGSAWPRKTEQGVPLVEATTTIRDVTLPQGALVQGVVVDSFGDPVANARVSIFNPRCLSPEPCTQPPTLLADASDGSRWQLPCRGGCP